MKRLTKAVAAVVMVLGLVSVAQARPDLPAVPEIDPSLIAGAATLISGGLLILAGKRSK